MNTQFASNVHEFTENLFKAMLEEFDGKEVGSDEFNLETLMDFHFPNYTPGEVDGLDEEGEEDEEGSGPQ